MTCKCGHEMSFQACYDDADRIAYNVYLCMRCGMLCKHDVVAGDPDHARMVPSRVGRADRAESKSERAHASMIAAL